jgi:hypothetical protein
MMPEGKISLVRPELVCTSSAFLALGDPYTSANLKGMLGLHFDISYSMLVWICVLGGLFLLVLQYLMIRLTARIVWRRGHPLSQSEDALVDRG